MSFRSLVGTVPKMVEDREGTIVEQSDGLDIDGYSDSNGYYARMVERGHFL